MPTMPYSVQPSGEPDPVGLNVDISCPNADTLVVAACGEADASTVPSLQQALRQAAERDRPRVVVDLNQLSFMDASAINALIEARLHLRAAGGELQVRCQRVFSRRLLSLCGLECMLEH